MEGGGRERKGAEERGVKQLCHFIYHTHIQASLRHHLPPAASFDVVHCSCVPAFL